MSDQRVQIIELLIRQTEAGKLEWEEGVNDGQYKVEVGSNTVLLSEKIRDGNPIIVVRLYNSNGALAETFTDEDLPSNDENEYYWYKPMENLLNRARRKALGTDEVMKSIIETLGKT
ncbi:hypothetical protein [Devosia elaeis]|uniref:Uncharacterized protein n=1 Tax=Devosia elaeis TaxID=1770058 RepID=A0A178HSF8_9HYPH|nr:hypothetical protein [Devosia elaeis]OAM75589.1 hypothetical protein A3840_14535 [Devosia elaeis]